MKFRLALLLIFVVGLTGCGRISLIQPSEQVEAIETDGSDKPVSAPGTTDIDADSASMINGQENNADSENNDNRISNDPIPHNTTQTSLSPDGKYRAEAYGTNTRITAAGMYPYEGIRVVDTATGEVVFNMMGYYVVEFLWSPESRYVGIYHEARIYGESIILDTTDKTTISLPSLSDIASYYGEEAKPQENRPDPYFKISGWEDEETAIVDFKWSNEDGGDIEGQFTYNINTKAVCYK